MLMQRLMQLTLAIRDALERDDLSEADRLMDERLALLSGSDLDALKQQATPSDLTCLLEAEAQLKSWLETQLQQTRIDLQSIMTANKARSVYGTRNHDYE